MSNNHQASSTSARQIIQQLNQQALKNTVVIKRSRTTTSASSSSSNNRPTPIKKKTNIASFKDFQIENYKNTIQSWSDDNASKSLKRNTHKNTNNHARIERSNSSRTNRSKSSGYLLNNLFVSIPETRNAYKNLEKEKEEKEKFNNSFHSFSTVSGVKSQGNSSTIDNNIPSNEKNKHTENNNSQINKLNNGLVNYAATTKTTTTTPKFNNSNTVNNTTYANE